MVGFGFPPAPGTMPPDDELVSQAGGCRGKGGRDMGGGEIGFPAGAIAFPFAANVPAPTGTGTGESDIAGMLFACGENMSGPETGLYGGYDAALGLPGRPLFTGRPLFRGGSMAPLFMKTPCGFAQRTCPGLLGTADGRAFARAAFRLRLINNAATRPRSNAPSRTARPPISSMLPDESVAGVPVLLPPLFPEFVLFGAGVWLLSTVGDAPTVGVAPVVAVVLAIAVAVGVTPGVVVVEGIGEGVGDGFGVGEGGTTGG